MAKLERRTIAEEIAFIASSIINARQDNSDNEPSQRKHVIYICDNVEKESTEAVIRLREYSDEDSSTYAHVTSAVIEKLMDYIKQVKGNRVKVTCENYPNFFTTIDVYLKDLNSLAGLVSRYSKVSAQ